MDRCLPGMRGDKMNRQEILQIAKPILFNTEMVRATLDGRKTVTRRVVKDLPDCDFIELELNPEVCYDGDLEKTAVHCGLYATFESHGDYIVDFPVRKSPYQVGDILYARETWSPVWVRPKRYQYKASPEVSENVPISWYPSIHMPKEAARIFLKVTGVRCERLQDISEAQIKAEGIDTCSHCYHFNGECKDFRAARECKLQSAFIKTWNSTIKKQDLSKYGWQANPWVWVYEFEKVAVE
ncbi:MAG: hypothetical protein BWY46_01412 [Firmicutes bacterium ADurb.Bin300]|nr:MAG: hypothetical protein BWY46_01412 [Firmicutes bacterium ADurb.Bin300]